MIVKELDPFDSTDPLQQAGQRAEEQMAFYLRRAFADTADVWVFHGLRLERDGDATQLDHLLLHRHGMVIVESKSVSTRVRINAHGEWVRCSERGEQGMPSPIQQVRLQSEFLRGYLEAHREELLGKFLGRQGSFARMPLDLRVAISDRGIVDRPAGLELPEVCKADQVVDRVRALLREYTRINHFFNLNLREIGYAFNADELQALLRFLPQHHHPAARTRPRADAGPPACHFPANALPSSEASPTGAPPAAGVLTTEAAPTCRHCGDRSLTIGSGRVGPSVRGGPLRPCRVNGGRRCLGRDCQTG